MWVDILFILIKIVINYRLIVKRGIWGGEYDVLDRGGFWGIVILEMGMVVIFYFLDEEFGV